MVKVKVLQRYFDRLLDTYKEKGEEFEVKEKRAEVLEKEGVARIMKEGSKKTTKGK